MHLYCPNMCGSELRKIFPLEKENNALFVTGICERCKKAYKIKLYSFEEIPIPEKEFSREVVWTTFPSHKTRKTLK